jgi:hypothetical protein
MARKVLVTYKVKPSRVEEHEALIRAVFAELAKTAPDAIRYGAFKRPDGVSFVHFSVVTAAENPLDSLASFKAFTAEVRDRCDEPPQVVELTPIGMYGL